MDQKPIFFHQQNLTLTPSTSTTPLVLLPSNLAIKAQCPKGDNPLEFAYNSKILDLNHSYICFDFALPNTTQCFFFPTNSLSTYTSIFIDLSLPPLLGIECAIFCYKDTSVFCFYQNKTLIYYKNIDDETSLSHCLLLISKLYGANSPHVVLFDYGFPHPFDFDSKISLLTDTLSLLFPPPLLTLQHKSSLLISLAKFSLSCTIIVSLVSLLAFYLSPPPPSLSPSLPQSKKLNISYPLYSLLHILTPALINENFIGFSYVREEGLILTFSKPFSQQLLQLLHSKGYKTNIIDPLTLRISI